MVRYLFVTVWGVAACGGAPEVRAPAPAPSVVVEPGLPAVEGKHGIVFSPDGAALELRVLATGQSVAVTDGTPLRLIAEQSGQGLGRAEAEVEIAGQIGILPNVAVLVGERLRRSPVAKVALFVATSDCAPACVSEVWALHPDGRRLRLSDGVGDPSFAFSPDGLQVAVGGAEGLWHLVVGPWRSYHYREFSAPAFAHDGVLYVRQHGAADAVYQLLFGGQAAHILTEPGQPVTAVPLPVTFADGGRTVVAVFARKGGDKTVRAAR